MKGLEGAGEGLGGGSRVDLPDLCFPRWDPRLRYGGARSGGRLEIWDDVRRQWVALTPEEWVRQSVLAHMVGDLGYPRGMLLVERRVDVQGQSQRVDILALDRGGGGFLLVECKWWGVALDGEVMLQALRYNEGLGSLWIVLTNGLSVRCYRRGAGGEFVYCGASIPAYGVREVVCR